jgi:hypothetical protein
MKTIDIDRARLTNRMQAAFGVVKYQFSAKSELTAVPGIGFDLSDCSNFTRWLIFQASLGKTTFPQGSVEQHQRCQEDGFAADEYHLCAPLGDNKLRIAFIPVTPNHCGHVWLVLNGQTIECCGGKGACRRPWNAAPLITEVTACYTLTSPLV